MPQRLHRSGRGSTSVPSGAKLVGSVKLIKAQKGNGSNFPREFFKHRFTRSNEMYKVSGVKSGVLIYSKLEEIVGKGGTIKFNGGRIYGLKNGNVFIRSSKGNFLIVGSQPLWDVFNYPDQ